MHILGVAILNFYKMMFVSVAGYCFTVCQRVKSKMPMHIHFKVHILSEVKFGVNMLSRWFG